MFYCIDSNDLPLQNFSSQGIPSFGSTPCWRRERVGSSTYLAPEEWQCKTEAENLVILECLPAGGTAS